MASFEDSEISGGILADEMGIGKTVEIIGLLLLRSNQRRLAIANGETVPRALPTLILMPKTLLTQWKKEIQAFTDRFRIVMYYGTPKKRAEDGVDYPKGRLTRSSEYFNGDESNSDTIVLSTYTTWATRHGPKAQTDWLVSDYMKTNNVFRQTAKNHVTSSREAHVATKSCAIQLQDCFERVVLDEGHEIRHMSPQVGTAVRWIGGKYRNVVTGTPILSGLYDFCGIMRFLQPPELSSEEYLRNVGFIKANGSNALKDIIQNFDPWTVPDDDPRAILRFTVEALEEWVFNRNTTNEQRGLRMRKIFRKCMIRRSLSSTIDGKRIGDSLPEVQRINIQSDFTATERLHHDFLYADTSSTLFKKNINGDALQWNTTTYRKLCLISSWLGMAYLLEYKATKLKKVKEHKNNGYRFLKDVRAGQKRANVPEDRQLPLPDPDDHVSIIRQHCTGSPKLRIFLALVAELVVLQGEKVTVWVNSPFQMEWLDTVCRLCGLRSRQLRADLSTQERDELIELFLYDPHSPQILICSYLISCAGVNMHLRCRTVIEFEPAPCQGVRDQMVGRVRRKNQTRFCRHITITTKDSFNTQQDAVTLLRSLPMLMTQLDLDVFGTNEADTDRDRALGDWVLHNDDIIPANDPRVAGLDLDVIDPDTLLMYISMKMAGQTLDGNIISLRSAAKGLEQKKVDLPTEPLWT
ncbi:SNF2 family N-terminal domain-containing protein [Boeremia exigua]|uniref:SNF2 family N-terminal domain-containing protein n=1 Tax=Boeremia exigua TaxID=749465 RepID=UPI001E8D5ACC|nr:SNF2 family N-terminal domain-containing protein [Boeremia exigua]KAH6633017.1 SNF2 family N-terminal domain-containing protein [Boeremia exigua]